MNFFLIIKIKVKNINNSNKKLFQKKSLLKLKFEWVNSNFVKKKKFSHKNKFRKYKRIRINIKKEI